MHILLFFAQLVVAEPDMKPAEVVPECVCLQGPAADEIKRLRRQITILKAEKRVNEGIERATQRRAKR